MNRTFARLAIASAATLCVLGAHATVFGTTTNDNSTHNAGGSATAAAGAVAAGVGVGVGMGGAGGQGGAGGSSAVVGSGNSSNTNRNTNAQGQQQGQAQSSRNSNRNSVTGTQSARTGDVTAAQVSRTGDMTGGTMTGGAVTVEGSSTVYQAQERNPVATAYAAPLTSSPETCMGSSSGGAQGASFGVSFGTTWESVKCDRRMNARTLQALGKRSAALSLMCQDPDVRKAMEESGDTCPDNGKRAAALLESPTMQPNVSAEAAQAQYQDPIIRARLNLPPLN